MSESVSSMPDLRRSVDELCRQRPATQPRFSLGMSEMDDAIGGGLVRGALHEVFALQDVDAAGASAFAVMLAIRSRVEDTPIFWLRTESAERRAGRLYAPGLAALGVDPGMIILGVMPDDIALLRSGNDAARCSSLGAVLIECWGNPRALDLTASRRLALSAAASGVAVFMLRIDARPLPSAAETRWAVVSRVSAALEVDAPGHAALEIELLRHRAGPSGMRWPLEWNHADHVFTQPTLSQPVVPFLRHGKTADRAAGFARRTA